MSPFLIQTFVHFWSIDAKGHKKLCAIGAEELPIKRSIIEIRLNQSKHEFETTHCRSLDRNEIHEMDTITACKDELDKTVPVPQKQKVKRTLTNELLRRLLNKNFDEQMIGTHISSCESVQSYENSTSYLDASYYAKIKRNIKKIPTKIQRNIPGWWILSKIKRMRYSKEISITIGFLCVVVLIAYSLKDGKGLFIIIIILN